VMRVCPIYLSEKESKAFKELARQALKERLNEKEQAGS